jgi:UDP-2,3-diacylglucosamine hydrolase
VSLFALSDLHIHGTEDPLYRALLRVIREITVSGDVLVLVGDVFDLFVGDKSVFLETYHEFLSALGEAGRRGVRIHYIEGNHDFLIERAFQGLPGLEVHPHDVSVEHGGKKFFFAHGDTVDRGDYGYRLLRGFFRSPAMKLLVAAVPGSWLEKIGNESSYRSRGRKPVLPAQLPPERRERLRALYRDFSAEKIAEGYDFVVMGHCHDLDEKILEVAGRSGQYVNVGYPRVHGSYLAWAPGDEKIVRQRLPEG